MECTPIYWFPFGTPRLEIAPPCRKRRSRRSLQRRHATKESPTTTTGTTTLIKIVTRLAGCTRHLLRGRRAHEKSQSLPGAPIRGSRYGHAQGGAAVKSHDSGIYEFLRSRCSMGIHACGYSGPTYSARGRIRRLSSSCSMTCAVQPLTRETANTGVNKSTSIPSVW